MPRYDVEVIQTIGSSATVKIYDLEGGEYMGGMPMPVMILTPEGAEEISEKLAAAVKLIK